MHYAVHDVPIALLMPRYNDETRPNRGETKRYLGLVDGLRREFATAFAVRGFGDDHARWLADVDHAFTCSQVLTDAYRDSVGLVITPLEPPIDWSSVVVPAESRAFVTFVNPSPHKGLWLFAHLADMLGSLPHVVGGDAAEGGGGRVAAIPEWMTLETKKLPTEQQVAPWYEAVCTLWDDRKMYDAVAERVRRIAGERYPEAVSRKKHIDYFTSLTAGGRPIPTRA